MDFMETTSGVLTTTVSTTTMLTDAEFDLLWEGNKRRLFTNGAWPGFQRSADEMFYADNIDDAKIKYKEYLNSFLNGVVSTAYKQTWLAKVHEGSNIVGAWLYKTTAFSDDTFAWPIPADLQQLWEDQGLSGDMRLKCVDNSDALTLPLSDSTPSNLWYLNWYTNVETFTALHTAFKAEGYTKVTNLMTGTVQKTKAQEWFNTMKAWESGGIPGNGPTAGRNTLANPVWNYVDDNTTCAFSLGLCQVQNAYADLDSSLKPCGWPLTTVKIGGEYPPYS